MPTRAATRVLVVEDEPIDALLVRRSLLQPGGCADRFEVRHATTLSDALDRLRDEPADVLLLDLRLPDSDGLDTVVRSRVRAPNLPLVVLTGSDDPRLAAQTLEAGADGHLVKGAFGAPALRGELLRAVERHAPPAEPRPAEPGAALLHDVRKLHTLVLANAQLLREEVAEEPALRARADALVRAARLASSLTEALLAGTAPPGDGVDVSELVRGVEPLLRAIVPARIALRVSLAGELPPIRMRSERLLAALFELVSNAVDAIGEDDGVLELATGAGVVEAAASGGLVAGAGPEPGPHVWLEVRDDGRGFDADALLARRPPPAGTLAPGYGASPLGRLLADGAGLFVDSRPGAGATFRILLPCRDA